MHDIEFYEDEHIYLVDGVEVPSVTTILNYLSDDEYSKVNQAVLEQAARRGTLVHEYTELMDYDALPDEIEAEVIGYIKAYKDFLRDYRPKWEQVECPVYFGGKSYKPFVGTLDRAGVIDGKECVVDIKTIGSPTKMNKFTVCSQTAAYALARKMTCDVQTEKRYALYLNKDGEYNLMDCNEYESKYAYDGYGVFAMCLDMYYMAQELKSRKPIKLCK